VNVTSFGEMDGTPFEAPPFNGEVSLKVAANGEHADFSVSEAEFDTSVRTALHRPTPT
jgi:hypothetical protein